MGKGNTVLRFTPTPMTTPDRPRSLILIKSFVRQVVFSSSSSAFDVRCNYASANWNPIVLAVSERRVVTDGGNNDTHDP